MAELGRPKPVKLIVALIWARSRAFDLALAELTSQFGRIDALSDPSASHLGPYEPEMGLGLAKRIAAFETLIDPAELAPIKSHTVSMERAFTVDGRRGINLDPGYLTDGNLVLASAKPRSRRVYLRDGVYAELELVYQSGRFRPLPWTYADYRDASVLEFLEGVRATYLGQVRSS